MRYSILPRMDEGELRLLTDAELLELVYSAATCYVPDEQLDPEQLGRFDNIRYRWCSCRRCKKEG